MWRTSDPNPKRCHFALKRQLAVSDVAMTSSCLIFSTNRGEAFIGYLSNKKISSAASKENESKHTKEYIKGEVFNIVHTEFEIIFHLYIAFWAPCGKNRDSAPL